MNMNLYEHTIIARQDVSASQLKPLTEKYTKIIEGDEVTVLGFSKKAINELGKMN